MFCMAFHVHGCESPKTVMFPLQAQVRRAAGSIVEEIAAIQALAAS